MDRLFWGHVKDGLGDGTVLVEATVADTRQLRWWLLGFGGRIEVLEPQRLRDELKDHAERMVVRYSSSGTL